MHSIAYYEMPNSASENSLKLPVTELDFSRFLTGAERGIIDKNWEKVLEESAGKAFYKPKGIGCLYLSPDSNASFMTTDFKTYVAISRCYNNPAFSSRTLDMMSVSSVGGVVRTSDGKVFVHRRSKKATHVPGAIDGSIAGICHVKDGYLDFKDAILSKLEKELKTSSSEVLDMKFTGIHSSREPDFSGMYTFDISTSLTKAQLSDRAKSSPFEEFYFIDENKLEEFILKEFNPSQPVCLDGCATFLASLPSQSFDKLVPQLREKGINISLPL